MQDELVGTIGFHAVKTAKAKPAKAKTAKPHTVKRYAINIATRKPKEKPGYDHTWHVDIINVPYDDTRGNVQSLTVEKRILQPVFTCAIFPSQLQPTRKSKRTKQRQNRKVARRLRAIAKAG